MKLAVSEQKIPTRIIPTMWLFRNEVVFVMAAFTGSA
jgi:hypothetical protein